MRYITAALLLMGFLSHTATAQEAAPAAEAKWEITGDAAQDNSRSRVGEDGSLKIGPGSKAVLKLRDSDGSGKVEMWIFDDMTSPPDPKVRRMGPRWGLMQNDGRMLVMGALYAPFLGGSESYATTESDGKSWYDRVQYSALKRSRGWHKWTFSFDPQQGLNIQMNDRPARFNWNQTMMKGFAGLVFLGDSAGPNPQTIWVDDMNVELGGPMVAQPAALAQAPAAAGAAAARPAAAPAAVVAAATAAQRVGGVPAQDPAPEAQVALAQAVQGKHPRLLFTAEELPALRAKAETEDGKRFYEQMLKYLPVSVPPKEPGFLRDATDGQRQGLWRLPTASIHYQMTGDIKSRDAVIGYLKLLHSLENWETGPEVDSGMSAANIMIGAAIGYDCVYNDLDPEFRDAMGKKLLLHARRMYYGGHLMGNPGQHYWQNDPHNNHRWHRNAGMALCILAVAGEQPGTEWLLGKVKEELEFIHKWLPHDGSSHESSTYMVFGGPQLMLAYDAADRCLGTDYLGHDFFKMTPAFRLALMQPGFRDSIHYGDSAGTGGINSYNFLAAARHKEADLHAGLIEFSKVKPDAFQFGWASLLWFDPSLSHGSVDKIPARWFFDDIGIISVRDGWKQDNVAWMFKCAPYGGRTLNEFRNANNFKYINVAHDDPDANMFYLYAKGQILADDDRYATKKLTSSHNTILVNGKGQKGEGGHWTQPLRGKDQDMLNLAVITAYKEEGDLVVAEGEAAGMYADLQRYRRTMIWVEGSYILMLDDIAATTGSAEYTWLLQGKGISIQNASEGQFRLSNEDVNCDVLVKADRPFEAVVGTSTAAHRNTLMDLQQLQLKASAPRWRLATVFDPWGRQLKLTTSPDGDGMTVRVEGNGINDTWKWQAAAEKDKPSQLSGSRAGGWSFSL